MLSAAIACAGERGGTPEAELAGVSGGQPEAISLLGKALHTPDIPAERRSDLEHEREAARAEYERAPEDADALIWLGRRTAYLGRYRDAIAIFTEGIERHPEDARMYRHRGHRYITVRRFDDAIADLERAVRLVRGTPDEAEPDGLPNPYGIPTSTLQTNIWYHLALAHYLKHDFERALPAWRRCLELSTNDDMRVATADWLYMTLRRLGREEDAVRVLEPIHADMRILENHAYHRRLLMYRGEIPPDSLFPATGVDGSEADASEAADPVQRATYGYAVGNWYLYRGERQRAEEIFRRVIDGPNWAAFGYIAAEAELAFAR